MKKIIALVIIAVLLCGVLVGCNSVGTSQLAEYKTAIIKYPNGEVITISVKTYTADENGLNVSIRCVDGTCYRTAWENVILIGE